ncbi:MAG TPA: hypothetical protein VF782_06110 [Allosphingosinicella sp.]|jgi:hypothetical protein
MRLAFLALALTLPAASAAEAPASPAFAGASNAMARPSPRAANAFVPSRICGDDMKPRHARTPNLSKPRRLGELPPGDLTLAVVNRVGDCIEPVIVRQGYGALDDGPGR